MVNSEVKNQGSCLGIRYWELQVQSQASLDRSFTGGSGRPGGIDRHLAHLATRLAELSVQSDRLASLCKIHARQSTDQRELAIYYGSMLMATTRVFNLDENNESESDEGDSREHDS
ncbi:hypothetical protein PGT21_024771 [Puccinia graminis f. sp. tritici]|uniref:Uncharacterized protein n=1 Tax=Puccinia graminis f. sp. tritici TaxID=56615 RepID=A0A5B0PKI3_PUCGR|nr:hypothetical protein PGT21_024771 [Puccinia graminis f. sp. tritici]